MYNDILIHYGVKGMKWGVRRTPEQLGYKSNKLFDSRLVNAQKHGIKAMSSYKKIHDEYDSRIKKAIDNNDWDTVEKLEDKQYKKIQKEVFTPLYNAGYDYVNRGSGSNGLMHLTFGKYLDDPEYDRYGDELWVDEYMIDNGDMKVYRPSDEW